MKDTIIIYTDGGCKNGNGTPESFGSWGVYLQFNGSEKKISGATRGVTNNQMEMLACIKALESLKTNDHPIVLNTDSAYVCNCINDKWYIKWRANGWKNSKKKNVENKELWIELLHQVESKGFDVTFNKVKGHSGDEGNEIADTLCDEAIEELMKEVGFK